MLIYFNGDSFTDGVGLGDAVVFPEHYPGNWPSYNKVAGKEWPPLRIHLTKENNLDQVLRFENRKRCWATHLGKYLDAEIINEAVGGSSMLGILTRTIHDLETLVKSNRIPDQVIIGLTSIERVPLINPNPALAEDDYWLHTAHPAHLAHLNPTYKKYVTEYWKSHSDAEMLTFFVYQCMHLHHYVKLVTGKPPLFLNTSNTFHLCPGFVDEAKLPLLTEAWQLLDFDDVAERKSLSNIAQHTQYTSCGHFTEEGNIAYAKYVAKEFFEVDIE